MIDVTNIEKVPFYRTCFLRRQIVKMIQKEIERPDYSSSSKDAANLFGLLRILNQEIKSIGKGMIK